jgi:hypothetical protein
MKFFILLFMLNAFAIASTKSKGPKYVKNNGDSRYGLEANLISPIISKDNIKSYEIGVSAFKIWPNTELYFPIEYYKEHLSAKDNFQVLFQIQYRRYFKGLNKGLYWSGVIDYRFIQDHYFVESQLLPNEYIDNRLGVGAGIGYRYFSSLGWYWGIDFNMGRHIIASEPDDENTELFRINPYKKMYYKFDFLKIGYRF